MDLFSLTQESCCLGSARRSYLHLNANTGKRTPAGWCHRASEDAYSGSLQNTLCDASNHDPPHAREEEGRKAQLCTCGLHGMSWPCLGRLHRRNLGSQRGSLCLYWGKLGPSVKFTRVCSYRVKCSYAYKGLKIEVSTKASPACFFLECCSPSSARDMIRIHLCVLQKRYKTLLSKRGSSPAFWTDHCDPSEFHALLQKNYFT